MFSLIEEIAQYQSSLPPFQTRKIKLENFRPSCSSTPAVWWPAPSPEDTTLSPEIITTSGTVILNLFSSPSQPSLRLSLPPGSSGWGGVTLTSTAGSSSPSCSSVFTWCTGWYISVFLGRFHRTLFHYMNKFILTFFVIERGAPSCVHQLTVKTIWRVSQNTKLTRTQRFPPEEFNNISLDQQRFYQLMRLCCKTASFLILENRMTKWIPTKNLHISSKNLLSPSIEWSSFYHQYSLQFFLFHKKISKFIRSVKALNTISKLILPI